MKEKNLRDEFYSALTGGASRDELLQIVRRYKDAGISQRETYDILECIREELGCHEDGDANLFCEPIEDVMDIVWGYCSQAKGIWTTSLAEENQK